MPEFLVELYVARDDRNGLQQQVDRVDRVAAALTRAGQPVRCMRAIHVPEDETCFVLVEAPSAAVVEEVVREASLTDAYVSAAASSPAPDPVDARPHVDHSRGKATPQ